jgi:hypothetical protein
VQRIRRAEYPQYAWDSLPKLGLAESVLRLDHTFPIARNPTSYQATELRLTEDALGVIDEWYRWLVTGALPPGSLLSDIRAELLAMP